MNVRDIQTKMPVFYAGFDPGSGDATLTVVSPNGEMNVKTIPSVISEGDASKLLKRGLTPDASLGQVLDDNEYVVNFNGTDYYLGDLIKEGRQGRDTSAIGAQHRYWSEHSIILLLALASHLIPDQSFELRIVTALPLSLYTNVNRKKVKSALENCYRFSFNGRHREAVVKVGYVAAEGQGVLVHCGDSDSEQVVLDIGERTFDLVVADGQRMLVSLCVGKEIGVGQLFDDLIAFGKTRNVNLERKAHGLLRAYINNQPLPNVHGINGRDISQVIADAISKAGRTLRNFISQHLASDGEEMAARYDHVYLAGGGAYYFDDIIRGFINPNKVEVVENAEIANALGYADIAVSLQEKKATIWEMSNAA